MLAPDCEGKADEQEGVHGVCTKVQSQLNFCVTEGP